MNRLLFAKTGAVLSAVAVAFSACGGDSTGVEFEVIEETEFAPSLGIDLAAMSRNDVGVYLQDIVPGVGDRVETGDTVWVEYQLHLSNGDSIGAGPFSFQTGTNATVPGFEWGVLGMRPGGQRKVVVPPVLGYGANGVPAGGIPGGAVLVFDIQLDSVGVFTP